MPEACWRCGAPWRCEVCGSFDQRPGGKGCAECHRTRERERGQARRQAERAGRAGRDEGFEVTPSMRRYLAAFDAYLLADREGDPAAVRAAETRRRETLAGLGRETRQRKEI